MDESIFYQFEIIFGHDIYHILAALVSQGDTALCGDKKFIKSLYPRNWSFAFISRFVS